MVQVQVTWVNVDLRPLNAFVVLLSCSAVKGHQTARDELRVMSEPSTGDVEIGVHVVSDGEPAVQPGSNASTMSSTMSCGTGRDSNDSSEIAVDEHSLREYELVRRVMYATRDNVNIVHEVFRQVSWLLTLITQSTVAIYGLSWVLKSHEIQVLFRP